VLLTAGRGQFEAAWVLTNIAAGESEHTEILHRSGAVPLLIEMLDNPSADVTEQVGPGASPAPAAPDRVRRRCGRSGTWPATTRAAATRCWRRG
jgi:hypothetical protein